MVTRHSGESCGDLFRLDSQRREPWRCHGPDGGLQYPDKTEVVLATSSLETAARLLAQQRTVTLLGICLPQVPLAMCPIPHAVLSG